MKVLRLAAALALLGATGAAFGSGQACSPTQAAQAEVALGGLHSWSEAIEYFSRHKACLDGGPSEGYTTFLAEQLAADHGVELFWTATRQQAWFRPLVAKWMESEVISVETTDSMLKNLRSQCPPDATHFCRELTKRIRAGCSACTSGP